MPPFLLTLLSTLGGGIGSIFGYLGDVASSAFKAATQFHQEGISAARDLGLGVQQAQAYTQALTRNTAELANKYGVTADAIKEIQRGISDATGRQLLLNEAETEGFLIMNKLVGAQTTNAFTSEIMNKMGGQVSTVQGAISKAYATAAKQGLNASKFSGEVAKNLTLANKLSFKDGINGIIKMTALSQKLGFNLQSIEAAASKFMDFDSAIESSAQLNMLGGSAGAYGSNPLEMMYEANYNPEAFTERMTKMINGLGEFDKKSGMGRVSGMNMDFARNIAKAMGISADEVVSMAKKSAEVKFKESRFGDTLTRRFGNDEEKKNYILNNSTYNTKTQRLELNGKDVNELTDADLANLMQFDGMSDHELMQKQAEALTSLPEQISGAAASVSAKFAEGLNRHFPDLRDMVKEYGGMIADHAKIWGENIGNYLEKIFEWLNEHKDPIKKMINGILSAVDFITNRWYMLLGLGLLGLYKMLRPHLQGAFGMDRNNGGNNTSGKNKASSNKDRTFKQAKNDAKLARNNTLRGNKGNAFTRAVKGNARYLKTLYKNSSLVRGATKAGGIGTALAIGDAALTAYEYSDKEKEILNNKELSQEKKKEEVKKAQEDRNGAWGGALGAIAGGAAAGAALGTIVPGAGNVAGFIVGAIGSGIGYYLGDKGGRLVPTSEKSVVEEDEKNKKKNGYATGGIVGGKSYTGDKIPISVNSGEMILNQNQQKMLFDFINQLNSPFKGNAAESNITYQNITNNNGNVTHLVAYNGNSDIVNNLSSISSKKLSVGYNPSNISKVDSNVIGGALNSSNATSISNKAFNSRSNVIGGASNYSNAISILNKAFNSRSNVVGTALNSSSIVGTKPFGENSFDGLKQLVKTIGSSVVNGGKMDLAVKDININISGTIKLDGGNNSSTTIDAKQLLSDASFVSALKELLKQSISNDINGGRIMNDAATMRGLMPSMSLIGRK